jgi:sugar phosphate isomerase/epimerase
MTIQSPSRRRFLATASAAAASVSWFPPGVREAQRAATASATAAWPIGCHTRPFAGFRASQTANPDFILDAVKAAGFGFADMISAGTAGGRGTPPVPPTPESISQLNAKLAARGLKSNIANFPTSPKGMPVTDAIASARRLIENAHALGQKYALNLGIEEEERWVDWCKVLSDAAAFGKERDVKVVVKHHHGLNNTSLDLLAWIKQVNHPNFGAFFDPGNVVYYTGKDPVKQLDIIGPHVWGVVAKDCSAPHFMERAVGDPPFGSAVAGAGNPEVMIQFGTGKVDFASFFKKLKSFGFHGPVMVEGTEVGGTLEQTIANARANREFLEKTFASV